MYFLAARDNNIKSIILHFNCKIHEIFYSRYIYIYIYIYIFYVTKYYRFIDAERS